MERTRYFRSANKFNIVIDFLAGNFLPLTDENTKLSVVSILWGSLVWFIKFTYVLTVALGTFYAADLMADEAFKKSGAIAVVCVELVIPTVYLNLRRKNLRCLIGKYNDILIDSDDLRRCVRDTVEPYKRGLKCYVVGCLVASCAWTASAFLQIIDNDRFTYSDYSVPAYYPGEPFTVNAFVAGIFFQMIGDYSIHFGKISIDIYVSYFITVLSAQYKFVRARITQALSQVNGEKDDELMVIVALQKCIRHQCAVIETGQMLAGLFAFHIGATYITCILKFCFLAFGVIKFGSAIVEEAAYVVYTFSCLIQVFLLCSCIQELLDVSTSVTDDAFHENWHLRGSAVKKIFSTIQLSEKIECRLSAYRIVDLVVPTLGSILSKSYSVCLLLLKVD